MFFFKKKPNYNRLPDKVWLSKTVKYRQLSELLAKNEVQFFFLVAYFNSTIYEIREILDKNGVKYQFLEEVWQISQINLESDKILLCKPDALKDNFQLSRLFGSRDTSALHFLIAEHYPVYQREQELLKKIGEISTKSPVYFYCSLDEIFFGKFGGERIIKLMQTLGIAEEEAISHSMIDKAIVNVQKKIESKVGADLKANSPEEWFKFNYS